MRRFFVFFFLFCFAVPFGAAVSGCSKAAAVRYCTGSVTGDSGPQAGQVAAITLPSSYVTYGISVDYGQTGPALTATATDCFGSTVTVRSYTYATTNMSYADINPSTGQVCGGMWNRNSGGGIADYTTCNPPTTPPTPTSKITPVVAFITATADGTVSNTVPVYVHPVATSVVIGQATPTASCSSTSDPSTNCCPYFNVVNTASPYTGLSCLSQGQQAQITSRVYQNGTTNPSDNITCQVGHVNYAGQNSGVFTVDQNGVLTAEQPGSPIVTASVANSGSGASATTGGAAGFYSTCPPASIKLAVASTGSTGTQNVALNSTLPLTATVIDTNGVTITGAALTYTSTQPNTVGTTSASIAPVLPGAATITAVCQPPTCNSAPFSQIGLFGNGKPVTSNGIADITTGTNATVIYIGSTGSQYLLPIDFSIATTGSPIRLPYVPNSMVITQDGSAIYLGSTTALMTVSTASNALSSASLTTPGTVLAVSPDGTTVVLTDPARQTVSLVVNGTVTSSYGGVGTHAAWSADSSTVYITTTANTLLEHSTYTGWNSTATDEAYNDLTVLVPSIGAFFAGSATEGRSYCPSTVSTSTASSPAVETNVFFPLANTTAVANDHVAATNDSAHVLGVVAAPAPAINDIAVTLPVTPVSGASPVGAACPAVVPPTYFGSSVTTTPVPQIASSLTSVNGIVPASNSALAFVTYTGTGGKLPEYVPSATAGAAGTLSYVTLSGAAAAPVAGVFSTDNGTFFAGTSGDNAVHRIAITGTTAADVPANVITPALPAASGTGTAVPNLLVQRPKKATS